jgi:hypothetical protein
LAQILPNTTHYSVLDIKHLLLHSLAQTVSLYLLLRIQLEKQERSLGMYSLRGFGTAPTFFGLALGQDLAEWNYPQTTLL